MLIEPIIFYILTITSLLLGASFLVLVFAYTSLLKKEYAHQKDLEELQNNLKQRALLEVEDARAKALAIVQNANAKAAQILQQAQIASNFSQEELTHKLKEIQEEQAKSLTEHSNQFLSDLHKTLEEVKTQDFQSIKNTSSQVQTQALSQIEGFRHNIESETIQTEERIAAEMEKQYEILRKELEEYKLQQMKKIDDSIYTVLLFISKEIIGKSLDLEAQEDLIKKVLEDAKKKGEFSPASA